jgi:hypothetical protein
MLTLCLDFRGWDSSVRLLYVFRIILPELQFQNGTLPRLAELVF